MSSMDTMTVSSVGDKNDLEEFSKLFDEISESVKSVKDNLLNMNEKINKKEISTAKGISLLEVKNQIMLSYLSNLVFLIMRKCRGKSIAGDPAIERLVEDRTVIERIQPIENKLKYQIDKLIKIASTGTTDKNDPKHLRANPDNLVDGGKGDESNSDAEDDSDNDDYDINSKDGKNAGNSKGKSGIYVPPRLVPVHYDGDNSESSKKEKLLERARKRALNSSVLQELHEEYLDNPVEVGESASFKPKRSKSAVEKQEYEETYFTRLPTTKKETHKSRRILTGGNLGGLTNFEDISVLDADSNYSPAEKKRKTNRKSSKNMKNKKGGFKRKRRK